jgi:diguanylate cyclase (GGDEF)-like protein
MSKKCSILLSKFKKHIALPLVLFGLWTLVVVLSLSWNILQIQETMLHSATLTAQAGYEKDVLYRRWNAGFNGVYVRPNETSPPNQYLKPEDRTIVTNKGEILVMLNPAYMARQVFELTKDKIGIQSRITSTRPINPANTPDSWELSALQKLESGVQEVTEIMDRNGSKNLRFIKPLFTEKACLNCHAQYGYKEGDLRGGLSIIIPLEPYQKIANEHTFSISLAHFMVWIIGLLGISYASFKYQESVQKERESEIYQKEYDTLQLVMDGVGDSIVMISHDHKLKLCNTAAKSFYSLDAMVAENSCYRAIAGTDSACELIEGQRCPMIVVKELKKPTTLITHRKDKTGQERTMELLVTPLWNEDGSFRGIIESARDITERVKAERKLVYLAHHDTLTQLPNRSFFEESLIGRLRDVKFGKDQLAVMFVDLDRFKNINDTFGHNTGDYVLIEIANRLKKIIPTYGIVSRFGGDEFTVLLTSFDNPSVVSELAHKIIEAISEPLYIKDYEFYISASIGISLAPKNGTNITSLMKCADSALYSAKNSGRNTYLFFTEMDTDGLKPLHIESALKQAINHHKLNLVFQPLVWSSTGKMMGMEVLSRWNHEKFGNVPPARFIPIAEETGLIISLGRQVLLEACHLCKQWNLLGKQKYIVTVNVSPRQFMRQDLFKTITDTLEITQLEPQYLEIEVTESSIMSDMESAVKILKQIRNLGIGVALDDFGTGYSSLSYLKAMPLSVLKIDRSFVKDIGVDKRNDSFIRTMISLAHTLDLEVIAEGIETEQQKKLLIEYGCDVLQGYLFSKPLPPQEILEKYIQKEDFLFYKTDFDLWKTILNFFK